MKMHIIIDMTMINTITIIIVIEIVVDIIHRLASGIKLSVSIIQILDTIIIQHIAITVVIMMGINIVVLTTIVHPTHQSSILKMNRMTTLIILRALQAM